MKDHHEYCYMKPMQCKYCELLIPQLDGQFENHSTYCGSKTRDCEVCGAVITARELESHIATGNCDRVLEAKETQLKETQKKILQEKARQETSSKTSQHFGLKRKASKDLEAAPVKVGMNKER